MGRSRGQWEGCLWHKLGVGSWEGLPRRGGRFVPWSSCPLRQPSARAHVLVSQVASLVAPSEA